MSGHELSHVDSRGRAHMVDVSRKEPTLRRATATGKVRMLPSTLKALREGRSIKGDVAAAVRIAGIAAAKETYRLIPLCHNIPLDKVAVNVEFLEEDGSAFADIRSEVITAGRTGVEMEALTAVSVAALTLYDMCKAIDQGMIIETIGLDSKEGGRRGPWRRSRRTGTGSLYQCREGNTQDPT